MSRQKASKDAVETENSLPVEPKLKIRNQQAIHHHLFKAEVATMKKNISWQKGEVKLRDVEHVHWYHSVNSLGMSIEHTNEVGGHFHEVTWSVREDGELVAKCGPALKKITQKTSRGAKTKIVPVSWINKFEAEADGDLELGTVTDNHVHVMRYDGSDLLSTAKIQEIQKQSAKLLAHKSDIPKLPGDVKLTENDRG